MSRAAAAAALAALALSGCAAPPASPSLRADAAWEAIFTRDAGWTGGDVANMVTLDPERVLWLFGDSFWGPLQDGGHDPEASTMIRNAAAVATLRATGEGPRPESIRFIAGAIGDDKFPAPWLAPPAEFGDDAWLWPLGDGAVVGAGSERRLVLFTTIEGPAGHPEGSWNFRRVGGGILRVHGIDGPSDRWRLAIERNGLVDAMPRHGEPPRWSDDWGNALVVDGARTWIFGLRSRGIDRHLLLATAPSDRLDDVATWRFRTRDGWSDVAAEAASLVAGLPDEFSIDRLKIAGATRFLLVHSEPFGRRILARAALRPEGPWSEQAAIHRPIDAAAAPELTTYAARAHPELSPPDGLLLTWIVSSSDFAQLIADAALYRPRCAVVPWDRLPEPPP